MNQNSLSVVKDHATQRKDKKKNNVFLTGKNDNPK